MITISDPFAAAGDVPGALPAGVYVRVLDDGRELALVQLDGPCCPVFVVRLDDGTWTLGAHVHDLPPRDVRAALAAAGKTTEWLAGEVAAAEAKGVSPFGG